MGPNNNNGNHQWYYYSRRTTQYRVTANGYWKPTGIEEPVISTTKNKRVIGIKKYFVFHVGESPSAGIRTIWIMQEYRLSDSASSTKWVICRVYEGNGDDYDDGTDQLSCFDEVFLSLDDDLDLPN